MMRLWNRKPDPGSREPHSKKRQPPPPNDEKNQESPKSPKPSAKSKKIEDQPSKKLVYENSSRRGKVLKHYKLLSSRIS